ncbi:hypothetical protein IJG14_04970 [bacterium]|nr:hypothetical protein [bacterium]
MRILLVLLTEILLTLIFVYFASNYYNGEINYVCPFDNKEYSITYVHFAAITYLIGGISTLLIYAILNITDNKTILAYKKEREKHSVDSAEKDGQIKALENKIKTLETALDNVIKNKEE